MTSAKSLMFSLLEVYFYFGVGAKYVTNIFFQEPSILYFDLWVLGTLCIVNIDHILFSSALYLKYYFKINSPLIQSISLFTPNSGLLVSGAQSDPSPSRQN